MNTPNPPPSKLSLLNLFIHFTAAADATRSGTSPLVVDGRTLSIPAVTALARIPTTPVRLTADPSILERVKRAKHIIHAALARGDAIYGVNTGVGGSSDSRSPNLDALGLSFLQLQLAGVLPVPKSRREAAGLPSTHEWEPDSSVMPEAWVRAAILVRANALVRGHSGVRVELIEHLLMLLRENVVPLVPTRGSISASGDLQPLSYVAATLIGAPSVRAYAGPARFILPAPAALSRASIPTLTLEPKEHLALLNGTSFSAGLSALVMHDAVNLGVLSMVLTAMGVEALRGSRGSFVSFLSDEARPHPGQVEVGRVVSWLLEGSRLARGGDHDVHDGSGGLKQDRYALRTAPQYLGPQIEDLVNAVRTVEIEINSSTDNPLIDPDSAQIHQGGNFQASALTSCTSHVRLALFHTGKLLFAQLTELLNPATSKGMTPSAAATDPGLNFGGKGLDIAAAAYVGELGFLAGGVVAGVSAEMHNQSVNSLALVSARTTSQAVDVLSLLCASYLYILCQALDVRAMQMEHEQEVCDAIDKLLRAHLPECLEEEPSNSEHETTSHDPPSTAEPLSIRTPQQHSADSRTIPQNLRIPTTSPSTPLSSSSSSSNHSRSSSPPTSSPSSPRGPKHFPAPPPAPALPPSLRTTLHSTLLATLARTTTLDAAPRMHAAAASLTAPLLAHFTHPTRLPVPPGTMERIAAFQSAVAEAGTQSLRAVRRAYLSGGRAGGAKGLLGRTRGVYCYVREGLGVKMHGAANLECDEGGEGVEGGGGMGMVQETIGEGVSVVYEAIRGGGVAGVMRAILEGLNMDGGV